MPLATLLKANSVALCINNQKNSTHRETTYQHTLPGRRVSVVTAPVRCVATVMVTTGCNFSPIFRLGTVGDSSGHATAKMVTIVLRTAACNLDLLCQGIKAEDAESHTLRAGGTVQLNECNMIQITKVGWWTSLTFCFTYATKLPTLAQT